MKMQKNLDVSVGNVIAGSKEEIKKQKERLYSKIWYEKNKELKKAKRLVYHHKNKNKKWYKKMRNKHLKDMYNNNINFKLTKILRVRLIHALNGNLKYDKTINLLGCSIEQLWNHLEKQFKKGMTRKNHGLWHIDHIKPCAAFDLTKPEEQQKCFHYTNLQPLWAKENLMKSDKYEKTYNLSD